MTADARRLLNLTRPSDGRASDSPHGVAVRASGPRARGPRRMRCDYDLTSPSVMVRT